MEEESNEGEDENDKSKDDLPATEQDNSDEDSYNDENGGANTDPNHCFYRQHLRWIFLLLFFTKKTLDLSSCNILVIMVVCVLEWMYVICRDCLFTVRGLLLLVSRLVRDKSLDSRV